MAAETWFNAEESIKYGFADEIASAKAKNLSQWNLAAWNKAPALPVEPTPPDDCQITQHLRRRLALVEKQAA